MATESNVRQSAHGVRTYRGRTLEELLPQIREELGPDAIILREREGLVGGVGGFFAQRFVEVDARRGDGQSIDIYDDTPEDDLRHLAPAGAGDEPLVAERRRILPPEDVELRRPAPVSDEESVDLGPRPVAPIQEPVERAQPRPFVPPSIQRAPAEPQQPAPEPPARRRAFETDVFLERLRAASAVLPDEDEEQAAPVKPAAVPSRPAPAAEPAPEPEPEPRAAALPEPEAVPEAEEQAAPGPPQPEPEAQAPPRPPERRARPERKPRSAPARQARPAPRGKETPRTRRPRAAAPQPEPSAPEQAPPPPAAPTAAPAAASTNPYEAVRQRPSSLSAGLPTAAPAPAAPAARAPAAIPAGVPAAPRPAVPHPATAPPAASRPPQPQPLAVQAHRHGEGALREVLARLLGGRFLRSSVARPSPPRPVDPVAAAQIATELSTRGASQEWASQLISAAGAHGSPLAGSLHAAAEAEVARRIVAPAPLPATGAAIAFVGAGGSGKTRCTAALASAYSRASTLGVTVVALDNPDGARELKRLLSDDGVPVLSLSGERAARAIEGARQNGFVIVDTPTATPTHADEVEALSLKLEPLALDATFVTLPATLGAQAARRALASFGRLHPSAVAITHADETDQLAVVVEIAIAHRIPLAYFHSGTDHRTALSAVDAAALAQQLLAP